MTCKHANLSVLRDLHKILLWCCCTKTVGVVHSGKVGHAVKYGCGLMRYNYREINYA